MTKKYKYVLAVLAFCTVGFLTSFIPQKPEAKVICKWSGEVIWTSDEGSMSQYNPQLHNLVVTKKDFSQVVYDNVSCKQRITN